MEIEIKDASPDGMHVVYKTFLMTWEDLHAFIRIVEMVESGEYKKLTKPG